MLPLPFGSSARLPQLLHRLPVRDPTLKHITGLTEYRASRYFARSPTCAAESGSLALCTSDFLWLPSDPAVGQQRPCQSDYLPLSQGDAGFFQPAGFASFAGQTKDPASLRGLLFSIRQECFRQWLLPSWPPPCFLPWLLTWLPPFQPAWLRPSRPVPVRFPWQSLPAQPWRSVRMPVR